MIGADHVDELGEAGRLHPVGMVDQRDQRAADHQRVLEIVDFLEQARRLGPAGSAQLLAGAGAWYQTFHSSSESMIRFGAAAPGRDRIGDRGDLDDEALEIVDRGEEPGDVACRGW